MEYDQRPIDCTRSSHTHLERCQLPRITIMAPSTGNAASAPGHDCWESINNKLNAIRTIPPDDMALLT